MSKKLVFAPIFLVLFIAFLGTALPFLTNPYTVFSLDLGVLWNLVEMVILLMLAGLSFIIFCTLSQDLHLTIFTSTVAAFLVIIWYLLSPGWFPSFAGAIILAVGSIFVLTIVFLLLRESLRSYLDFRPTILLIPSVRLLAQLVILLLSLIYFLSLHDLISNQGFQLPDSIFNQITSAASASADQVNPELPNLSDHPLLQQLLQSQGLATSSIQGQIKSQVKNQIQQSIKERVQAFLAPFIPFLPFLFSILFLLTLVSTFSILSWLLHPLTGLVFYAFEKSGFTKFVTEERPVRKLVV